MANNSPGRTRLYVKVAKDGVYLRPDGSPIERDHRFAPCDGHETVGWDATCTRRIPQVNGESGVVVSFARCESGQWQMVLTHQIDSSDTIELKEKRVPVRDLTHGCIIPLSPGDRGHLPVGAGVLVDFTVFTVS